MKMNALIKKTIMTLFLYLIFYACFASNLVCPPVDASGTRRIDAQAQHILEQCIKSEPTTKSIFYNPKTHQYTAQRELLHKQIINDFLKNKPCIKTQTPVAILTGGLPGSGKTTFLKNNLKNFDQYFVVDADAIREKLPEYKGWDATDTQEEVSDIVVAEVAKIGKPCNINFIYDSSMSSSLQRYTSLITQLKNHGYKVYLVYAKIPLEQAKARALTRYQKEGRYVPLAFLNYVNQNAPKIFEQLKSSVDGFIVVDGATGKIIEQKNAAASVLNKKRS